MKQKGPSMPEKSIEGALRLYDAQAVLFQQRPSRLALLALSFSPTESERWRVNVWRNHAFEPLLPLIEPYCTHRGWQPDFFVSGYDDTLVFDNHQDADIELLWLDSSRFLTNTAFEEWLSWLAMRLRALRACTVAPIILATWVLRSREAEALQALADSLPAVYFADMGAACDEANVHLLDPRSTALAGTPVGKAAQLVLARKLACHWLPASFLPPVKAVALDLDHTLHFGVLGEDGIDGVQLTAGHAAFQRYIKSLQEHGVFIALVSRNERLDVETLFSQRLDYPLRWEDFSAIEISWGDKSAALERIAKALRIAPDSILFIDDNPGELANVSMQLPQVHTVFAHQDASLTQRVVHFYPGLWRWKAESEDGKRVQDLKASTQRAALAESFSTPEDYFRSLQVALIYRYDPREQLNRLAELCIKTNQLNLALRRFNHVEIAQLLERGNACVASVQLTDRFSDSGVIAVIIAERVGEQLVVEELCVSCRAMGRQLESTIIVLALRGMPIFNGCREVAFRVQHGPRNQPALDWLGRFLERSDAPPPGLYALPAQRLSDFVAVEGISLSKG